ncbi:MAG: hypothetical protein AAFX85_08930 [Pseudomonadota bacterium]
MRQDEEVKVRRATAIGFSLEDQPEDTLVAALKGRRTPRLVPTWTATSPLTGQRLALSTAQLHCLSSVTQEEWTSAAQVREHAACSEEEWGQLLDAGLLLSNARRVRWASLRSRDQHLRNVGWSPAALGYHLETTSSEQGSPPSAPLLSPR